MVLDGLVGKELEETIGAKLLTFSLQYVEYRIKFLEVREIMGIQDMTDLPDVPHL